MKSTKEVLILEYPFALTKLELKRLEYYTPRQKETYIMKKYIHGYRFANWLYNRKSTQTECWRQMNDHLISIGYKPKKSIVSVHRIWDAPFTNLDIEEWDYYGGDY